jgi:hypothetical protein
MATLAQASAAGSRDRSEMAGSGVIFDQEIRCNI